MANLKFGRWEYSQEELDRQFAEATPPSKSRSPREPRAQTVEYDPRSERIVLDFDNGTSFAFPTRFVEELVDASPEDIADVSVIAGGTALHWDSLDLDLGVPELLTGIYGTRRWMAQLGQKGGSVISEAKAAAARENGRKGGRPPRAGIVLKAR